VKILYMGNNQNGLNILRWLKQRKESIVGLVVHPPNYGKYREDIISVSGLKDDCVFQGNSVNKSEVLNKIKTLNADLALSIHFGYILKRPFLDSFPRGCINLHPAYLPYNRGVNSNVWSIIDETPAGITMHYIDEGVDTGDLIAQKEVPVEFWDTGVSLYEKLEKASLCLFRETWPSILSGTNNRIKQSGDGTNYFLSDFHKLDKLDLDKQYNAKELINILRARTFPPYEGCHVEIDGKKIYLSIEMKPEEGCLGLGNERMLLRRVLIDDRDDIYLWRNDEVARKYSFNRELITYEEHCRWFKKALEDLQKVLFVGIDEDGERCGVVRFDLINDFTSEIHITIAPEKRGRGIGATLIEKSCKLFFDEKRLKLIYARIMEQNQVSINVFIKTGFCEMFRYIDEKSGRNIVVMAMVNLH